MKVTNEDPHAVNVFLPASTSYFVIWCSYSVKLFVNRSVSAVSDRELIVIFFFQG